MGRELPPELRARGHIWQRKARHGSGDLYPSSLFGPLPDVLPNLEGRPSLEESTGESSWVQSQERAEKGSRRRIENNGVPQAANPPLGHLPPFSLPQRFVEIRL